MELYNKYRPTRFKDVMGQEKVIKTILGHLKKDTLPRMMTFTGPSGVGKTTVARILRKKTHCDRDHYKEINAASETGIDLIREIEEKAPIPPWVGDWRIWLIDEAHQLSKAAQNCSLKIFEEPPPHVRFILCTTEPDKLLTTIRTRCHEFCFDYIPDEFIQQLLQRVIKKEKFKVTTKLVKKIVVASEGSGRRALNYLQSAMAIDDEQERLDSVFKQSTRLQVIDLVRAVINNPRLSWKEAAQKLRAIQDEPEKIRWAIIGYAGAILINGQDNARAAMILAEFRDDTFSSGRNGLIESLYSVCHNRR